ncbi:hypothetical protein B0H17DRAFT_1133840 [Mycena rosella]|uniref:Uncharacterized protein n=1 Tax=Mycena rosella TaxID=1033263 RepID=A0AAD7GJU0_MYCRO|nr:hypothetical protein B0H17DRAFT_1133840 [Mycena rosella]
MSSFSYYDMYGRRAPKISDHSFCCPKPSCGRTLKLALCTTGWHATQFYLKCYSPAHTPPFWYFFPKGQVPAASIVARLAAAPCRRRLQPTVPVPTAETMTCAHNGCGDGHINKLCSSRRCKKHCLELNHNCRCHHPPPPKPLLLPALSGVSLSAINAIEHNAKAKAAEQTFILVTWTRNNKPAFVQAIQGCPLWPLWTRGGDEPYKCYSSSYRTWMHVPASYVHKLSGEPLFVRTIGVNGSDEEFQLHCLLTHNKLELYIYSLSTPSIRRTYQASSMSTSSFPPSSASLSCLHQSSSSASTSITSIPKKVGKHNIICIESSDDDDGEVFFVGQ